MQICKNFFLFSKICVFVALIIYPIVIEMGLDEFGVGWWIGPHEGYFVRNFLRD